MLKYNKTKFEYLDLRDKKRTLEVIKNSGADVVVNCASWEFGLDVLDACIKTGVHSLDLGSDIPDTRTMLAKSPILKKAGLIHLTGYGSVPGIGNVMLNYAAKKFDKIDDVEVGFAWNSNIKKFVVPYSIESILTEFTYPAPIIHNHKLYTIKPINTEVKCYHRAIGKENQINMHHPEMYTFPRFCKNKGVKNVKFFAGFPDHSFEKIISMIDLGLASEEHINVNGAKVKPIEFMRENLKRIKIPRGYKETENLWVELSSKNRKILMECIVQTLDGWEEAGSNIDTGMPASIIAQMIKEKVITKPGSFAPEEIVPPEPFFKELRKRKMDILENGKLIN